MNKTLRRILHLLVIISILLIIGVGSTFITSAEVGETFTVKMHQQYMRDKYYSASANIPIKYKVINENPNEVEIIKYSSNIKSFGSYHANLPNKVKNPKNNQSYTVTAIGNSAFKDCTATFNITIPNNITTISDYAFYDCYNLRKITIPNSVTTIGDYAFCDCFSLTKITIPNSVTTIGDYAFAWTSLTSIVIPDSVTTIGNCMFYICESLTTATIPDSVTTIGDYAFYDCTNLTKIEIPDSVITIGNYAFYNCSNLFDVTSYTDSPAHIGNDVFSECPVDIIIPAGTTTSYVAAGWPKDDLSELIKSVKVVDESGNPIKRAKVILYLNKYTTFALTEGYTNSDGVYTCPADILCDTIEVSKPGYQQVEIIDGNKFEAVVVMKETPIFTCRTDEGADITYRVTTDKTVEVVSGPGRYYIGDVVIPETIQYDGLDYTVTGIAERTFENCIGIKNIVIPDSVTRIEKKAFYGCASLYEVTSNSLTPAQADSAAFVGCSSKIKIYIPTGTRDAYIAAGWPEANLVERA